MFSRAWGAVKGLATPGVAGPDGKQPEKPDAIVDMTSYQQLPMEMTYQNHSWEGSLMNYPNTSPPHCPWPSLSPEQSASYNHPSDNAHHLPHSRQRVGVNAMGDQHDYRQYHHFNSPQTPSAPYQEPQLAARTAPQSLL